ncbi:MAG TPA: hypothetical protein VGG23_02955, partial [Acidimicrobiales bacterium]
DPVCDVVCVLGDDGTLFAKNSDRPPAEAQRAVSFGRRAGGGTVRTQYLELRDTGAFATVLSQPTWLWGAEHGLNEHRLAIGNEMVFTVDDPRPAPAALIGMDLVRLGLERAATAEQAVDVMTTLLERHGQGGIGDQIHGRAYWSSFLIADPSSAWVLETSGRRWAARPVTSGAAISNRLTLRQDWTRASAGIIPGTDIDSWRHPRLPTGFADIRLTAGEAFVRAAAGSELDPGAVAAALRDHGTGPWGAPCGQHRPTDPPPAPASEEVSPDGAGWTLCLHAGETAATTASMVALLPADPTVPARAWMALGHPCVSVYVPVPVPAPAAPPPPAPLPAAVTDASTWARFAALAEAVGSDAARLAAVRARLSVLEDGLWQEADDLGTDAARWDAFGRRASAGVTDALDALAAAGLGSGAKVPKNGR